MTHETTDPADMIDQPDPTDTRADLLDAISDGVDPSLDVAPADADPAADTADQPAEPPAEPQDATEPEATPPYIPPVPEGAAERLAALEDEIKAVKAQRESGELDYEDADNKLDALRDERADLKADMKAAHLAEQAAHHQAVVSWEAAQARFRRDNEAYYQSPVRYAALDAAVKAVAAEPTTKGRGYDWILNEAKARVERDFGVTRAPAKPQQSRRPVASAAPPPMSPTDIAGGSARPASDFDAVNSQPAAAMLDAVMEWSPEKREEWLSRRL